MRYLKWWLTVLAGMGAGCLLVALASCKSSGDKAAESPVNSAGSANNYGNNYANNYGNNYANNYGNNYAGNNYASNDGGQSDGYQAYQGQNDQGQSNYSQNYQAYQGEYTGSQNESSDAYYDDQSYGGDTYANQYNAAQNYGYQGEQNYEDYYQNSGQGNYQEYEQDLESEQFNARATAPVTEEDFINQYAPNDQGVDVANNRGGITTNQTPTVAGELTIPSETPLSGPAGDPGEMYTSVNPEEYIEVSADDDALYSARLVWVGYDYRLDEGVVRVEMVTEGTPKFALFQTTRNSHRDLGFREMVVRFYQTTLRGKLTRAIDATEFLSPVSYVRMYAYPSGGFTDVVITLREVSPLKLYANQGNLLATFSLPEKYLLKHYKESGDGLGGSASSDDTSDSDIVMAEDMTDSYGPTSRLLAQFYSTSELPLGYVAPDPAGDAFSEAPSDGGEPASMEDGNVINYSFESDQESQEQPLQDDQQDDPYDQPNSQSNDTDLFTPNEVPATNSFHYSSSPNVLGDAGAGVEGAEGRQVGGRHFITEVIEELYVQAVAQNSALNAGQSEDLLGIQNPATDLQPSQSTTPQSPSNPANSVNNAMDNAMNSSMEGSDITTEPNNAGQYDEPGFTSYEAASMEEAEQIAHPVNFEFRNAKLSDVIDILGAENNINFVYDFDSFKQKVITMQLTNVSWTHALQAVLNVYDLGYIRLSGGVIKILPASKILKAKSVAKTRLLIIRLSYMKAEDAEQIINAFLRKDGGSISVGGAEGAGAEGGAAVEASSIVSDNVNISIDSRTNSLIIEAPDSDLAKMKTLVERLDTQTPQVKIDARIIQVENSSSNAYGIDWGLPFGADTSSLNLGSLPLKFGSKFAISAPGDGGLGSLNLRLSSFMNVDEINMQLQWEEKYLDTRVLQNTSAIVLNNKEAVIESGTVDTITWQGTATQQGGTTEVTYLLRLGVTPQVTSDGSVSMEVSVESDDPVDVEGRTRKSTKKVTTHLLRASGETASIGGIYTNSITDGFTAFPYLHKMPILGWLFRNHAKGIDKKEIVILLTPTILNLNEQSKSSASIASVNGNDYNYNSYSYGNNANYSYQGGGYNDYQNSGGQSYNYQSQGYGQSYDGQGYNQSYQGNSSDYYNQGYDNSEYDSQGYDDASYGENYANYDENYDASYEENYEENYDASYEENYEQNSGQNYSQGYEYQSPSGSNDYEEDSYYNDNSYDAENTEYYSSGG